MKLISISLILFVVLSGCKSTDPRAPVPPPTIVKPELKKAEDAVKKTTQSVQTVYRTVEKIIEKYPDDGLVKELQEQAAAAQAQSKQTEAAFQALKLKVEAAQLELVDATEKLKQWRAWYNAEYEKRVKAEAGAKRKGKWLVWSGLFNVLSAAGLFLLVRRGV